ncbi:hypothetical protein QA612_14940 [Evansella sp. AB-P1]|uniref:hypothetical protein n=1 Tax=Evansella sp. AB-P1 TaxID=3037653 RepID=UPI00241FF520|nr:hypothetical protein [Evansella sp. AB-P1]MDG5788766.1 hypothetical protein [Evansella sp. AB-P1]
MRPIIGLAIIILLIVSVYYDLSVGTIPQSSASNLTNEIKETDDLQEDKIVPYQEVIVEAGQTVYGIVQALHADQGISTPPHLVVEDFEALNPNTKAHEIIIGHSYRFPLYHNIGTGNDS